MVRKTTLREVKILRMLKQENIVNLKEVRAFAFVCLCLCSLPIHPSLPGVCTFSFFPCPPHL